MDYNWPEISSIEVNHDELFFTIYFKEALNYSAAKL